MYREVKSDRADMEKWALNKIRPIQKTTSNKKDQPKLMHKTTSPSDMLSPMCRWLCQILAEHNSQKANWKKYLSKKRGIIGNPKKKIIYKTWREKEPLPTKIPQFWRQNPQNSSLGFCCPWNLRAALFLFLLFIY